MTPLKQFEEDAECIIDYIQKDNYETAKFLYDERISTLTEEEKRILDFFINSKIYFNCSKLQKAIEDGFNGLFKEIRAINQKLWGKDTAINGTNAK